MTNTALLAVSSLLLFAYLLDIVGRPWKLPSLVLLIGAGIARRNPQHLTPPATPLRCRPSSCSRCEGLADPCALARQNGR